MGFVRSSFIADISITDLRRLRAIVKRIHLSKVGSQFSITDHEADKIIESIGPEVREAMIKTAVDRHGMD